MTEQKTASLSISGTFRACLGLSGPLWASLGLSLGLSGLCNCFSGSTKELNNLCSDPLSAELGPRRIRVDVEIFEASNLRNRYTMF